MKITSNKDKIIEEILNILELESSVMRSTLVYKIKDAINTTEQEILQILSEFNMKKWAYGVLPEEININDGVVVNVSVIKQSHRINKSNLISDTAIKLLKENEYLSISVLSLQIKEELAAINMNASERLIRDFLIEYSGDRWQCMLPLATPEKFFSLEPLNVIKVRKELLEKFLNIENNKEKAFIALKNSFIEEDMPVKKFNKTYKKLLNENLNGYVFTDEDVGFIIRSVFFDKVGYAFKGKKGFISLI
ncbi:hypothetical protein [Campylobacter sp. RM16192]|uniref:hypothetical protein n=1 Tax=Campylobacter sp. RM16192 TaxID=1660080 RepID=UPI001598557F|nr:hypothetical protein [Campylobacter sp. RM16192]QKU36246.1 hypothetical protein CDOMC_a034 [Campylobacter sp. RM16192]